VQGVDRRAGDIPGVRWLPAAHSDG
jgi:hypothetical protein